MKQKVIEIKGARVNNLKNIDVIIVKAIRIISFIHYELKYNKIITYHKLMSELN